MGIAIVLPFVSFLLFFLIAVSKNEATGIFSRIREGIVFSFLANGAILVIMTELLSYNRQITYGFLVTGWISVILLELFIMVRMRIPFSLLKICASSCVLLMRKSRILSGICLLLVISFIISVVYPPNNFDAMTYHMARVAHWQQNKAISFYPTHIPRQLVYQPFAEWIILHFQVLSHTDRFANAVQLFAFAASIVFVTLIAKALGGDYRQQLLSGLFAALIPMAVIQSNTAQNDVVVASLVLCFIYACIRSRNFCWRYVLAAGVALGLALLTKGTAYIFVFPFCLWFAVYIIRSFRKTVQTLLINCFKAACVILIALSLNLGHFSRNIFFSGNPLGSASDEIINAGFKPGPLLFVLVKDFCSQMPVNLYLKYQILYQAAKLNINADDYGYSLDKTDAMGEHFSFHEDYAQNPLHTLALIVLFFAFFLSRRNYGRAGPYLQFVLTFYFSCFLFCILLKWQPWINRLETSLFFQLSVVMGMEFVKWPKKILRWFIVLPVIAYGVASLLLNNNHPLLPVTSTIFMKPYDEFIYDKGMLECRAYLDKQPYQSIGLYIGKNSWDYPYFKLLQMSNGKQRRIGHVMVNNESSMYVDFFVPDAILSIETRQDAYQVGNILYKRKAVFDGDHALYAP